MNADPDTDLTAPSALRWGIIGAGGIAHTVGADIRDSPGSEVVAVAARDADRAASLASTLRAPRSYDSYQDLVDDDEVDVVYIATTHDRHLEHARLAMQAGKGVLVEKPVGLNQRQAVELFAAAEKADVFCMEAMWMRCNPLILQARDLVRSGELGAVTGVHADFSFDVPYDPSSRLFDPAVGGGALLDVGIYPATFAWLMLGAPDSESSTGALAPTGVDGVVALQWGYERGAFAQLSCAVQSAGPNDAVVTCTDGWIRLSDPLFFRPGRMDVHRSAGSGPDGEMTVETVTSTLPGNGYGPEIAEVERCVAAGLRESPLVPWQETIDILGILDRARAALGVRYEADRAR